MPLRPSAARKIKTQRALAGVLRRLKAQGKTVVFTNGCFDLLHAGHVELLQRAKRLGDILVVGLNSDSSTRKLKGPKRPVIGARSRAIVLAALESVDYVTIFNEATPRSLIEDVKPHVLIKGADWSTSKIVGNDIVRGYGGRLVRIPLIRGHSTSKMLAKIFSGTCQPRRR